MKFKEMFYKEKKTKTFGFINNKITPKMNSIYLTRN